MVRIKVKLKPSTTIPQPTVRGWNYAWIIGFVTMGDGIGYAVVQTEHGEFETVPIHALLTID